MTGDVIMPNLGLTMEEGTVSRWLAAPGQQVERGQPLFEVETDKVSVEVEAPASGRLGPVLVEAGRRVAVGTVLARIDGGDEGGRTRDDTAVAALRPTPATLQPPIPSRRSSPISTPRSPSSSPRARKIAKERGIDWRTLAGSGPHGRVIERDVPLATHFGAASHLLARVDLSPLLDAHHRLLPLAPDVRLIDWLAGIVGVALDEAGIAAAIASASIRIHPPTKPGERPSLAQIAATRRCAAPATAPLFTIHDLSASRIDAFTPALAPAEIACLVLGRKDTSGHATLSLSFAGSAMTADQAVRLVERAIDLIEEPGLLLAG
jgi:hypothetical protein